MSNNNTGLGEQVYSGAADFGKFTTLLTAIFLTIISIIGFIAGFIFLSRKNIHTSNTMATIIKSDSPVNGDQNSTNCVASIQTITERNITTQKTYYECYLSVKYTVNDKEYTRILHTNSPTKYDSLSTIQIYYDPNNPQDSVISPINPKTVGSALILTSLFLLLIGWVSYYIISNFKFAAAGVGAANVFSLFRR